jgi:hypothetical protein
MSRPIIFLALLLGMPPAIAADAGTCGLAYIDFVHRTHEIADALSGKRLAFLHRRGLRIFDACETGHLDNPERRFRALERS